jgi:hypothetical protein
MAQSDSSLGGHLLLALWSLVMTSSDSPTRRGLFVASPSLAASPFRVRMSAVSSNWEGISTLVGPTNRSSAWVDRMLMQDQHKYADLEREWVQEFGAVQLTQRLPEAGHGVAEMEV